MEISEVFENNKKWVEDKLGVDENYFEDLSKGQSPRLLYIGCSDSRVSAETLMMAAPGDIFVHRNIANMVPNADLNVMSVIEYAVAHLKVGHVVVCGHYGCGGIKAAMGKDDLGILNPWLRNIRDVARTHKDELNQISDEPKRYNRLAELNVWEQCINVLKTEVVQRAQAERNLQVHGWVFDIQSGHIIDLEIDEEKILDGIKEIYRVN